MLSAKDPIAIYNTVSYQTICQISVIEIPHDCCRQVRFQLSNALYKQRIRRYITGRAHDKEKSVQCEGCVREGGRLRTDAVAGEKRLALVVPAALTLLHNN